MITRKRGRSSNCSSVETLDMSCSGQADDNAENTDEVQTAMYEQSSPESSYSHSLELGDLFTIDDFNWAFDKDSLSPLIGLHDRSGENTPDQDPEVDVTALPTHRGSAQRTKLKEMSGRISNKNAIAARMNRMKKKEYVSGLEHKVGSLSSENHVLKQENGLLNKRVDELENETRYLRAVLANESMLGQLLSRLSGVNGMKFSTSLFQGFNKNDHDYALPRKKVKSEEETASGGVCLHVDKDHVSVEFCTKCAESASTSLKM